jgi:hypothetical protein
LEKLLAHLKLRTTSADNGANLKPSSDEVSGIFTTYLLRVTFIVPPTKLSIAYLPPKTSLNVPF